VDYLDSTAAIEDHFLWIFRREPFVSAIDISEGRYVDPYTLTTTFKADAEADGATFETDVEVTGLVTEEDAVTGVRTTDGSIAADHVVVAAGWRTRELV